MCLALNISFTDDLTTDWVIRKVVHLSFACVSFPTRNLSNSTIASSVRTGHSFFHPGQAFHPRFKVSQFFQSAVETIIAQELVCCFVLLLRSFICDDICSEPKQFLICCGLCLCVHVCDTRTCHALAANRLSQTLPNNKLV